MIVGATLNVVTVNLKKKKMPRKKLPYDEKVVPTSFGIKRRVLSAFEKKVEELGFNRSEIISQYMEDFIKIYK